MNSWKKYRYFISAIILDTKENYIWDAEFKIRDSLNSKLCGCHLLPVWSGNLTSPALFPTVLSGFPLRASLSLSVSLGRCLWLPSLLSGFVISPGLDTIPSHDTCILSSDQANTCFAHYFSRSIACAIFILYRLLQNQNSVSFQVHHSPLSLSALVRP